MVALVGIFVPVVPGVPLAALAALLAAWLTDFERLSLTPLLLVAGLTLASLLIEYVAGLIGAKRYGASRSGVVGSVVGSLVGLVFFPPFGFILGALGGAVIAELLSGRVAREAFRAGLGVFLGALGGMFAQVVIMIALALVVVPRLV